MLQRELFRVGLSFLAFGLPFLSSHAAQSIVGVWPIGDGSDDASGFIAFYPNGYYFHAEEASFEEDLDGIEKGIYVWNETSGALGSVAIDDTNGDAGISHIDPDREVTFTVDGDTLNLNTVDGDTSITRGTEPANTILGAWYAGEPSDREHLLINFFDSGYFILGVQYDPAKLSEDDNAQSGMERGTYTWDPETGAITISILLDTNGDFGISGIAGIEDVTLTVNGTVLTISSESEEDDFTLNRPSTMAEASVDRSLVGSWRAGTQAILNILDDGIFYTATHIESAESPLTGMEHGTYTVNPETFLLATESTADTNGEAGLSGYTGVMRLAAQNDMLYLSRDDGFQIAFERIKGEADPLLGSWLFGDPEGENSAVLTFFEDDSVPDNLSGYYVFAEDVSDDNSDSSDGIELGMYRINRSTHHIDSIQVIIDTNGKGGFSGFGPGAYLKLLALGDSMVAVTRDNDQLESTILNRVSDIPYAEPSLVFDKVTDDRWVLLYQGLLVSGADPTNLSLVENAPGSPWFLTATEAEGYFQALLPQR